MIKRKKKEIEKKSDQYFLIWNLTQCGGYHHCITTINKVRTSACGMFKISNCESIQQWFWLATKLTTLSLLNVFS